MRGLFYISVGWPENGVMKSIFILMRSAVQEIKQISARAVPSRAVRYPIGFKITIPFLILAAIISVGAAYLVYKVVFENIDDRFTNSLLEAGKLSSDWMVHEEERMLETMRLLSHTQGVSQAVLSGNSFNLRDLTFGTTLNKQEEVVEFLDNKGNPVLTMRHQINGKLEDYSYSQGGQAPSPQWPFVDNVLQGVNDPPGNDKFAGMVLDNLGDTFYVAGPLYDDSGNLAGVVLVGKSLPTLVREMRSATLAQITLYNDQGNALATSFPEMTGLSIFQAEIPAIFAHKNTSSMTQDMSKLRSVQEAAIDYMEVIAPWQVRYGQEQGLIGVALPKNFIVSTSQGLRGQIFLLIAGALFMIFVLGVGLSISITRPLIDLMKASLEASKGNLDVRVPPTSNDEVGILTKTFDQMIASLDKSNKDLLSAYDSTLEGWVKALALRDQGTEDHAMRVTIMTVRLASLMGITGQELVNIRRGALLHDIGKVGIPDAILQKPGPLMEEEWKIMKLHPIYAVTMLKPIEFLRAALDIPQYHHEKWDGSGYPKGIKGEEIPLAARLFTVVDVWDALRDNRYYRPSMPEEMVIALLKAESGTHFDPHLVDLFLEHLDEIKVDMAQILLAMNYEQFTLATN